MEKFSYTKNELASRCFSTYRFAGIGKGMVINIMSNEVLEVEVNAKKYKNVISDEMVDYVGILTKLELTEQEREDAKIDMGKMLDYIDIMKNVDTSDAEPLSHIYSTYNVLRKDEVTNSDRCKALIKNAPESKENMYVVPKTF